MSHVEVITALLSENFSYLITQHLTSRNGHVEVITALPAARVKEPLKGVRPELITDYESDSKNNSYSDPDGSSSEHPPVPPSGKTYVQSKIRAEVRKTLKTAKHIKSFIKQPPGLTSHPATRLAPEFFFSFENSLKGKFISKSNYRWFPYNEEPETQNRLAT